jgi:uncharacterized protein
VSGSGIPDGLAVQPIYIVEISYSPDASAKRPAVREEHLTRIGRLLEEGKLIEAGGYLDFSAAVFLVPTATEEEALALVRDDVYLRSGVWIDDAKARAFGRVVREGAAEK